MYERASEKCTNKGDFHRLARTFFTGSVIHFSRAGIEVHKQKNKSVQLAPPTFSQDFPTRVSPRYPQLDPIYYDYEQLLRAVFHVSMGKQKYCLKIL